MKSETTNDFAPSEMDFIEPNLDDIYDDSPNPEISDDKEEDSVAVLLDTTKGKPCLLLNGFTYRKAYNSKAGSRWVCSKHKNCPAFLFVNNDEEITKKRENHNHPAEEIKNDHLDDKEQAVVITSRKGKEMLLYRNYTYRRHLGSNRGRWVCSTVKNCKAFITANEDNFVLSTHDEHYHEPPKYYLKRDNVLNALAQSVIIETD